MELIFVFWPEMIGSFWYSIVCYGYNSLSLVFYSDYHNYSQKCNKYVWIYDGQQIICIDLQEYLLFSNTIPSIWLYQSLILLLSSFFI